MRTLDALSRTAAARAVLQVERLLRGTVRDAHALVDPTRLGPVRIAIATGCRPSKVAPAILQFVAAGLTELEPMLPTLERFERERARLRREKRRAALRAPQ